MSGLDPGSLSAAIAGAGIYVSLLPHLADVRKASVDSATGTDVKTGIGMASLALVGTGAVIAVAEKDGKPLAMTIALALLMGGIYWWTLRLESEHPEPPESVPDRWGT